MIFLKKQFIYIFFILSIQHCYAQTGWQWATGCRTYDGQMMHAFGQPNVITDVKGNVYISGIMGGDSAKFGSFFVYNPNFCNQMVIAKLDSTGNYQWVIHSPINEYDYPISMGVDADENLYTIQLVTPIGVGYATFRLTKYAASGDELSVLGFNSESIVGIGIDTNKFVYVSGDLIDNSIYLKKYFPNLTGAWVVKIGGSVFAARTVTTGGSDAGIENNLAVAKNGDVYIYGYSQDTSVIFRSTSFIDSMILPTPTNSFFLVKYNTSGRPRWAETINPGMHVMNMTCDDSSNIYLTGIFESTAIVGSDTFGVDFFHHFFLCKYASDGSFQWLRSVRGNGINSGYGISIDSRQNIWIDGFMNGSMVFDGYTLTVPPRSSAPMFIANYDGTGNYISSRALTTGGLLYMGIACDNRDNFYLGGTYSSNISFGRDTLFYVDSLTSDPRFPLFVAKYKYCCSNELVNPISNDLVIKIYPNPSSKSLSIVSSETIANISISDVLGRCVLLKDCNSLKVEVDVAKLPPGVYLILINGTEVRKFIKI